MKAKKILIFYVKGLVNNIATVERMFTSIVNEMSSEGRQLRYINKDSATFEDGSRVKKIPFGQHTVGARATHLYIDEEALNLKNGEEVIKEMLLPIVVDGGTYKHLDVEGEPSDRIMVFNSKGVNKYNLGE